MRFLDFEQPIAELEAKIEELRHVGVDAELNISEEISRLESKSINLTEQIFSKLNSWQISQLARHPLRPYTLDYIDQIFTDFEELHGDRAFADDAAIVGGVARLDGLPVMVIGQQKGRDTKEKVKRNFGMPRPEGYRKAMRLMHMAERFKLPISTYSVISPEGCASILWKSADKAPDAAEALGLTSKRLKELGLVDRVIQEPRGGAHRNIEAMALSIKNVLMEELAKLQAMKMDDLLKARYQRLMSHGKFTERK